MKNEGKKVVVVIGSGRSGTSAITRGLHVLGVNLGDNLMPAVAGVNDKGFWEDQDIYRLNLEIFEALNHEWHNLSALDLEKMDASVTADLRSKALDVLSRKLEGIDCFGIKDPQMTRILPFWKGIFSELGLDVSYVIACRSLDGVLPSLTRYTGFDDRKCLLLWFEYTLASLVHTVGEKRIVVDYDKMITNSSAQLLRIAKKFGFHFDTGSDDFSAYRDDFLDKSLRHVKGDPEFGCSELMLPFDVASLFGFLSDAAADNLDLDSEGAISYVAQLAAAQLEPEVQLKNALCELNSTRSLLALSRSRLDATSIELEIRTDALDVASSDLKQRTDELVFVRGVLAERTDVAEKLDEDLKSRTEELVGERRGIVRLTEQIGQQDVVLKQRAARLIELEDALRYKERLLADTNAEVMRLSTGLFKSIWRRLRRA